MRALRIAMSAPLSATAMRAMPLPALPCSSCGCPATANDREIRPQTIHRNDALGIGYRRIEDWGVNVQLSIHQRMTGPQIEPRWTATTGVCTTF